MMTLNFCGGMGLNVFRLREFFNNGLDKQDRMSVNDFIVKAAAVALVSVPQVNGSYQQGSVHQ
jgi:pyruvate/2-oxoglutarate dehydrogenase complex dihydrolipoamide acyltransferase (E2) component